jgi:hypothetical protein
MKAADIPTELREQLHALQARKVQALIAGRSTLEIAAELRDLCAYIDARPWEDYRGNREPGQGGRT